MTARVLATFSSHDMTVENIQRDDGTRRFRFVIFRDTGVENLNPASATDLGRWLVNQTTLPAPSTASMLGIEPSAGTPRARISDDVLREYLASSSIRAGLNEVDLALDLRDALAEIARLKIEEKGWANNAWFARSKWNEFETLAIHATSQLDILKTVTDEDVQIARDELNLLACEDVGGGTCQPRIEAQYIRAALEKVLVDKLDKCQAKAAP